MHQTKFGYDCPINRTFATPTYQTASLQKPGERACAQRSSATARCLPGEIAWAGSRCLHSTDFHACGSATRCRARCFYCCLIQPQQVSCNGSVSDLCDARLRGHDHCTPPSGTLRRCGHLCFQLRQRCCVLRVHVPHFSS